MSKENLQIIRESFGRVVYSHKTHEKASEIEKASVNIVKWVNIILITLTSGTLISTIITNELTLVYVGTIFSSITLAFVIFQLSFNPQENMQKHKSIAQELWYIRERYVNLIADILNKRLNEDSIVKNRDELLAQLNAIYKLAPSTSSKAYKKAREALKINEELTFSDSEIDAFLPKELKIEKNLPPSGQSPQ